MLKQLRFALAVLALLAAPAAAGTMPLLHAGGPVAAASGFTKFYHPSDVVAGQIALPAGYVDAKAHWYFIGAGGSATLAGGAGGYSGAGGAYCEVSAPGFANGAQNRDAHVGVGGEDITGLGSFIKNAGGTVVGRAESGGNATGSGQAPAGGSNGTDVGTNCHLGGAGEISGGIPGGGASGAGAGGPHGDGAPGTINGSVSSLQNAGPGGGAADGGAKGDEPGNDSTVSPSGKGGAAYDASLGGVSVNAPIPGGPPVTGLPGNTKGSAPSGGTGSYTSGKNGAGGTGVGECLWIQTSDGACGGPGPGGGGGGGTQTGGHGGDGGGGGIYGGGAGGPGYNSTGAVGPTAEGLIALVVDP